MTTPKMSAKLKKNGDPKMSGGKRLKAGKPAYGFKQKQLQILVPIDILDRLKEYCRKQKRIFIKHFNEK